MFDEPDENDNPSERALNPADQAKDRFDEFRMHAELAAVFEGHRKFDAAITPGLNAEIAREVQRGVGKLEKAKLTDTPVITPESAAEALSILMMPKSRELATGDYHIHRRPGEVMIIRWLAGAEVETFYERFQAHFQAALKQFREEERQQKGWKQDPKTIEYLDALDKIEVKMPDRYLRPLIKQHNLCVLSTQTADEMDILHLCDFLMGVEAAEIVGSASAPPEEPTERDRAWFFKLFSLRGIDEGVERMCFFAYLQKSEDDEW